MYLKLFLASTLGLFSGITLAYKTNFSTKFFLVSLFIILVNFLIYKFVREKTRYQKNKTPVFIIVLFIFLALGILLGQGSVSRQLAQAKLFTTFTSQKKSFTGTVYRIEKTDKSQQLFLHLKANPKWNIKVITEPNEKYILGDVVSFTSSISQGQTLLPQPVSENNFSYSTDEVDTLNKILGESAFPKISLVGHQQSFFYQLKNYKNKFVQLLRTTSDHKVSALGAGTTLGVNSLFSKTELNSFRSTGLSHIIVLSGFNVTVLILFFGIIFRQLRLNLKWRTVLTVLALALFIIFVGANASLVRAAIMGSFLLVAEIFGRQYLAKQGLFLAALVMLILNPVIAVADISFHLSFLATLGILYVLPILNDYKIFHRLETHGKFLKNISQIFKLTLAVQILVIPYIMFQFGTISIFGLLTNILVVPFVPIVMLLTLLIILSALIFSPLAIFFGYLNLIFCQYIFSVAHYFSQFSFAKISSSISLFLMGIIYLVLICLIYFEDHRLRIEKYYQLENS